MNFNQSSLTQEKKDTEFWKRIYSHFHRCVYIFVCTVLFYIACLIFSLEKKYTVHLTLHRG